MVGQNSSRSARCDRSGCAGSETASPRVVSPGNPRCWQRSGGDRRQEPCSVNSRRPPCTGRWPERSCRHRSALGHRPAVTLLALARQRFRCCSLWRTRMRCSVSSDRPSPC
jgi:hypothetical protein